MAATPPIDFWEIARNLNASIEKLDNGTTALQRNELKLNLSVQYLDDSDGLKDGLIFKDRETGKILDKKEVVSRLDAAIRGLNNPFDSNTMSPASLKASQAKAAWATSLKKFILEDRTDFYFDTDFNAAVISENTIKQGPFQLLLANGSTMEKLQPINWNLQVDKMHGVVKALNNIARMEGQTDVQFQLEPKTGRVTYFSTSPIPKEELSKKVTALIEHIVTAGDSQLGDGKGGLSPEGRRVASKMDAFKNDRYYIAFEKETGFEPAYLVDLVENAQIAISAKSYLNLRDITVRNALPYEVQGASKVTKTEDGNDAYSYRNWNLTSKRSGHIGEFNQMAAIPNLTTQDNRYTNKVTNQSEQDLVNTLNEMRGALPIEFSPDPEPEALKTPKPVHKAKNHQNQNPPVKKKEAILI